MREAPMGCHHYSRSPPAGVNGLRACRKKTFDTFVGENFPDFLCLQEVKLNQEVIPKDDFNAAPTHEKHTSQCAGSVRIGNHPGTVLEPTLMQQMRGLTNRRGHKSSSISVSAFGAGLKFKYPCEIVCIVMDI